MRSDAIGGPQRQPAVVRLAAPLARLGRGVRLALYLVFLMAVGLLGELIDLLVEWGLDSLPPGAQKIVAVVVFGPIVAAMVGCIVYIEVVRRQRISILPRGGAGEAEP